MLAQKVFASRAAPTTSRRVLACWQAAAGRFCNDERKIELAVGRASEPEAAAAAGQLDWTSRLLCGEPTAAKHTCSLLPMQAHH